MPKVFAGSFFTFDWFVEFDRRRSRKLWVKKHNSSVEINFCHVYAVVCRR